MINFEFTKLNKIKFQMQLTELCYINNKCVGTSWSFGGDPKLAGTVLGGRPLVHTDPVAACVL